MEPNRTNQPKSQIDGRLALKSGVLYLIAEMVTRGISFLSTPVFTRLLPPAVFADAKIYESWVYLIAPVISLSLYQSMARAKFDFQSRYSRFLSSILFLMTAISVAVLLLSLPFLGPIEHLLGYGRMLLLLMLGYCLAYNAIQCVQLYDRQLLNYRRNIALTMLGVVPGVLTALALVLYFRNTASDEMLLNMRIVGFFLPTTLVGFALIAYFLVKERSFASREFWQYGIKYSVPLMATAVASQVFFQSGNIFVRNLVGADAAAVVAVAMTVGYIMDILIHALDNAWKPWMFEQLNAGGADKVKRFWKLLFLGTAILVLVLTIFAPELTLFLGGRQYMDSIPLICPILCASLANFLMIGYTSLEQYYKKTKISGIASIVSAVIDLVLNFVLIRLLGYQAAAYALAAAYLTACLVHYLFVRRFEKQNVLQSGASFGMILGSFVVCMACTALHQFSFLARFGLVLALAVVALICFRRLIFQLVKTFLRKQ